MRQHEPTEELPTNKSPHAPDAPPPRREDRDRSQPKHERTVPVVVRRDIGQLDDEVRQPVTHAAIRRRGVTLSPLSIHRRIAPFTAEDRVREWKHGVARLDGVLHQPRPDGKQGSNAEQSQLPNRLFHTEANRFFRGDRTQRDHHRQRHHHRDRSRVFARHRGTSQQTTERDQPVPCPLAPRSGGERVRVRGSFC